MLIAGLFFFEQLFHFFVSVACSRSWESVMDMGGLVGGASAGQWVAERNRGGLGEKSKRGFRKDLRGNT